MAQKQWMVVTALWIGGACMGAPEQGHGEESSVICPDPLPKISTLTRSEVYKDVPFKAGEKADYEVTYMGAKAGYGHMEVRAPQKFLDLWHRTFHAEAQTGDWFNKIFKAHDIIDAISRPWDFGISSFYMEQNEGKLFSSPFQQKKWLEFDHSHCKVSEKTVRPGKDEKHDQYDLAYGAIDALGVVYYLRTREYSIGKKVRALVYTSEKNWWLDADPVKTEKITVGAGTFDTVKLKLQTFIGKELQQKGDVFVWIGQDSHRPLVQVQGDIKIGSIWMMLESFQPGS